MLIDLHTVRPGRTLRIPFSTFDKDDGSTITMTNYSVSDILIYKDGSTTERASTSGFTATTDFDSKTGKHLLIIDLADNTTAGFFAAGSEYLVGIDAVTVDGVTVGGWVARFVIGYQGAIIDTTIATVNSQTSIVLTTGPAEADALKGCYAIIHDQASAVQLARVLITAYGTSLAVTLGAAPTFTIAAGDNISIFAGSPAVPDAAHSTAGGLPTVGTSTGQISLSGGAISLPTIPTDWITSGGLAASAVNEIWASVADSAGVTTLLSRLGTPSNLGSGASVAANLADIESQTDDIGVAGAGLTAIPWNPSWDAEVQSEVSDELTARGATSARFGYLDNVNTAYDGIRGVFKANTIYVDGVTFAESTRSAVGLASANLDTQLSTIDGVADAILDDTGSSGVLLATDSVNSTSLAASAVNEIWASVADSPGVTSLASAVAALDKILKADEIIDDSGSPWEKVYLESGTANELFRKRLLTVAGGAITSTDDVIGQSLA